jgi:adenylate cyclase
VNRTPRAAGPLVGLLAALAAGLLARAGAFDRLEAIAWDLRARTLADPAPADLPVRIVLIDDPSLAWAEEVQGLAWPWPREIHAAILRYLVADGARAVVLDYDFPGELKGVEDNRALHDAIAAAGNVALPLRAGDETRWRVPPAPYHTRGLDRARALAGVSFSHEDVVGDLPLAYGHVLPEVDADSVVRRVRAVVAFDGQPLPQLALAGYLAAPRDGTAPALALDAGRLTVADRTAPLDDDGNLLLRFRRPRAADGHIYPVTPAAAVIGRVADGAPPDGTFRGCYVCVGFGAESLFDSWPLPVKPVAPGVEVHATVIDNLLTGTFLAPAAGWLVALLTALVAVAAAHVVAHARRLAWTLGAAVLFVALPPLAGGVAWAAGTAPAVAWPTAAVALAALGGGALNYATEGRQRRYLRRAFGRYLSPAVIERIVADPARLELGGERRTLSIFFSDLEGFSAISETMDPQALGALLNEYLGDMTDILLAEEGTLDKYGGDAIIAFWNAPADQTDHALRAVRTGLRCQRRLAERRARFRDRTGHDLRMRIGVHTGEVSVGNFGSAVRFDYTMLGDAANLASRLEGANKRFGTYFMISEATWEPVRDEVVARELGRVRVVGRAAPVRVFEPLCLRGEAPPDGLARFEAARAACVAGDWDAAEEALALCDGDPVAAVWLARVRQLREDGASGWDDVWNLTRK